MVKIDSGDYRNFGTGTNVDVQKPFLLFSNRNCRKVLAASVRWDEALQQYMEVGHRLVIPLSYPGWCVVYFWPDHGTGCLCSDEYGF